MSIYDDERDIDLDPIPLDDEEKSSRKASKTTAKKKPATRRKEKSDDLDDMSVVLGEGVAPKLSGKTEPEWYVVHCYSGQENKVHHSVMQRRETMNMQDKIIEVLVPTEEELEIKEGKRRKVERRVFPGYILVKMVMDEDSWYVVRNTPGVTGFVGMGTEPTPLRPEELAKIIDRMGSVAPVVKLDYNIGDRVRIKDGPFNDFPGTVSAIDSERSKVRVMVNFFGRETPVELDFLQVEKV